MASIYVGNLTYSTTESQLNELFSKYGVVKRVKLINDRETGRPKGFGFVEMESGENEAISKLNETEFLGRTIRVSLAKQN